MSPALNGNTALQRFEHGNGVEICNGIIFDFYLGLLHIFTDDKDVQSGITMFSVFHCHCNVPLNVMPH